MADTDDDIEKTENLPEDPTPRAVRGERSGSATDQSSEVINATTDTKNEADESKMERKPPDPGEKEADETRDKTEEMRELSLSGSRTSAKEGQLGATDSLAETKQPGAVKHLIEFIVFYFHSSIVLINLSYFKFY